MKRREATSKRAQLILEIYDDSAVVVLDNDSVWSLRRRKESMSLIESVKETFSALRAEREGFDELYVQGLIQLASVVQFLFDEAGIKAFQKRIDFDLTPYRAANLPAPMTEAAKAARRSFYCGDGPFKLEQAFLDGLKKESDQ